MADARHQLTLSQHADAGSAEVTDLNLDLARTALLCLDMHNVIVERVPAGQREKLVETVRRVLDAARRAGLPVIYVAVGRRRKFMSPRNKFTGATGFVTYSAEMARAMSIVEAVAPLEHEPIVRKPEEAVECFLRTKMDVLVMGNYVIEKARIA